MKSTVAILAALVILAGAAPALAQDWVMEWTSHGSSVGILTGPFSEGWSISGTSPAGLTPSPTGMPVNFTAPAYELGFTWQGRSYGGPVSEQTNFQSFVWNAPVPCAGIYTTSCTISAQAFGSFALTDPNHFSLDVNVGLGHEHTELVGTGTRSTTVASTAEPATMAFGAIGLLGAAVLRRRRRVS